MTTVADAIRAQQAVTWRACHSSACPDTGHMAPACPDLWGPRPAGHPAPLSLSPSTTPGGPERGQDSASPADPAGTVQSAPDDGGPSRPSTLPTGSDTSAQEGAGGPAIAELVPGRRGWEHDAWCRVLDVLGELPGQLGRVPALPAVLVAALGAAQRELDAAVGGVDVLDVDGLVAELTIATAYAHAAAVDPEARP